MKKLIALSLLSVTLGVCGPIIHVYTALAPNAYGSPSYAQWVDNAIYALQNDLSAYGTPGAPTYFEETSGPTPYLDASVTSFPSWLGSINPGAVFGPAFGSELGNRPAFPLFIDGNGSKFSISQLGFTAVSSDSANALGFSWGVGTYYNAGYVGGIITGNTITYVTGGLNTQLVDFLWGRGSGNALVSCGSTICLTPADQQADIYNTTSILDDQTFTGTYSIGAASGSANFTFIPEPGTWGMILGAALVGLGCIRRRRLTR